MDLIKDGNDNTPAPGRRHQIPGLRQTPYLKIYLVRCDDNETYKASSRKQIRDWIKSNAQQAESKKATNNHENHDAFEWLIVHVIVPEAIAAAQSRISKDAHLGTTDSSDSINNKSKWTGRSTSNVLEKLRADFNGYSKPPIDRVAQIRISNPEQQLPADVENQFHDLVEKLKVGILSSFDLRVRQYEEDIREKDSQRSLPGWNFNTFFILKEGLARGFENVGLFDDSLVVYDELAIGLDAIVHDQLEGTGSDHGSSFLRYSDELKDRIHACLKDTDEGADADARPNLDPISDPAERLQRRDYPLDASRSPFRELILANDISIFDFRLYIFSRQLGLLLRSANAFSIADQPSEGRSVYSELDEQFLPLAEACHRALKFITTETRTLRHDLELALQMTGPMSADERSFRGSVISNFILSWTYVSSLQVLTQTGSPNLALPPAETLPSSVTTNFSSGTSKPNKYMVDNMLWSPTQASNSMGSNVMGRSSLSRSDLQRTSGTTNKKTGAEELAGARAELYLLARAAVQQIGNQCGWTQRMNILSPVHLQDMMLETAHDPNGVPAGERTGPVINGLQYLDLRNTFLVQDCFKTLFGSLTVFSYRHSLTANRTNFAERAVVDIAILKYEAGEFEAAASYLIRMASFYSGSQWTALEGTLLELYADCMKKLGRHGECATSLLKVLGKVRGLRQIYSTVAIDRISADLWSSSQKLTTSLSAKLSDFFSIRGLASDIRHHQDRDGFFISMEISYIGGAVEVPEGLQMTLHSVSDSTPTTILLHSQPVTIDRSFKGIELSSNWSICGWYAIDSLQIKVGNLLFVEDYKAVSSALVDQPKVSSYGSLRFFLYPPSRSLQAAASPAPYLHLAQPRSILIEMKTGWNEIHACTLSMKSATAGLRLHLHDASIDSENGSERPSFVARREGMQAIRLANCPADSKHKLLIPYTLENAGIPVINAKLEIEYSTAKGDFIFSSLVAVNTILPISVNVQDVFRQDMLLSRFTISPATLVPLRLWKYNLTGSENIFTIESHIDVQGAMDVFPKQPASLLYKFTRLQPASALKTQENSLALCIEFSCLDEVVLKALEEHFIRSIMISPVANVVQPLCSHLLSTFRSQWSAQDLEVIGLCQEIEIWPYEDLDWDAVLKGFDVKTRGLARTWLKKWHRENALLPIYEDLSDCKDVPSRVIVIPVDIPTPSVVVTASLKVDPRHTQGLTISETLLADLQISHTRKWAAAETPAQEDVQLEILFEVLAPIENWLIGGMRKGYLRLGEKVQSVPVILLPQRTGHLLLPSVDVKCYRADTSTKSAVPPEGTRVPCEVEITSSAQSVHVVSGLRETVVEIAVDAEAHGQIGSEKRSWLVSSKGREPTRNR